MSRQPETLLQRKIQKALKERNVWLYKVWGNELTPAGIPDLVGVFEGQFVAWEVKIPVGKLSDIQVYRIGIMRQHGAMVCVARSVGDAVQMIDHITLGYHDHCLSGKADKPCPYLAGALK